MGALTFKLLALDMDVKCEGPHPISHSMVRDALIGASLYIYIYIINVRNFSLCIFSSFVGPISNLLATSLFSVWLLEQFGAFFNHSKVGWEVHFFVEAEYNGKWYQWRLSHVCRRKVMPGFSKEDSSISLVNRIKL